MAADGIPPLEKRQEQKGARKWIEQRILNDAGILGHYVSDGANPHHSTIHYNGWEKNTATPNNYTTDDKFHSRLESEYVQSQIRIKDLLPLPDERPRVIENPRAQILTSLRNSNNLVERLYQLDKPVEVRQTDDRIRT